MEINLRQYGIDVQKLIHNASPPELYEHAFRSNEDVILTSTGALAVYSGTKTGRSPKDKRIVRDPATEKDIWWGEVNIELDERTFMINRERAIDYLNTYDRLYVVDGFAGWDPEHRIKIRLVCSLAYHALFIRNMLIRPDEKELAGYGEPDYVIFNAGKFPANRYTSEMTSKTSIDLSFRHREFVILGTQYAGEMKKGVFTIINYIMPKKGILSMHCSANEGQNEDVSLFFGLSGTGKTTLSADSRRKLIGDDEHCWSDRGIFNVEGGCYAKCINLSPKFEPEIYQAIGYETVLENVTINKKTRDVNYDDGSITENTRASYPIEKIPNVKTPCVGPAPNQIIFLTCDAFGVLPLVSLLTSDQASYHFISGYTAKVAGTETGVSEPQANFSACFGAPFMVWHPSKYAELLAKKIQETKAKAWLVNTGWIGGTYGVGKRVHLPYTRAIIDAIHDGSLDKVETTVHPVFNLKMPKHCPRVPDNLLDPKATWKDQAAYDQTARKLAQLFIDNFKKFEAETAARVAEAGPRL